ncbi:Pyruvate dehydrogenase E1 component subunit beta [Trichinella spiralis]|uniref:Pyruvate dehydrogenase E1 component subunit beta n=1 Tax=Trichinella spiralis TaxID=6334 RepID=A0ABR3KCX6_TRISP
MILVHQQRMHCRSTCGTAALHNLKQWLPNLRWYKCRLPNRRRKTRLLNQFSKNYNGAQKKGICKLIYKKNKNVYSLENILKMHEVNFTKTVSKGDLEVHIGRYKVERNGFILIAEAVQRTQRDALELSAFTAIEFLCYSNIFQDISNVIRTSLFKADPSLDDVLVKLANAFKPRLPAINLKLECENEAVRYITFSPRIKGPGGHGDAAELFNRKFHTSSSDLLML